MRISENDLQLCNFLTQMAIDQNEAFESERNGQHESIVEIGTPF